MTTDQQVPDAYVVRCDGCGREQTVVRPDQTGLWFLVVAPTQPSAAAPARRRWDFCCFDCFDAYVDLLRWHQQAALSASVPPPPPPPAPSRPAPLRNT